MSHTPGPWECRTNRVSYGGPLPPLIEVDGKRLATVEAEEVLYTADGNDRDCDAENARDDANARLMAAAPDLLAALKAFLHADPDVFAEELKAAHAAIAKATQS